MVTTRPILGLSSYAYRWAVGTRSFRPPEPLDAFGLLGRAARLGVGSVQFCDNLPLSSLDPGDRRRLLTEARRAGVRIGVGTTGLDVEHITRQLELGAEVGAGSVRLVLGRADPELAAARLHEVLPACRDLGVGLAIENHSDLSSAALAHLISSIGDPLLRICLDTANSIGLLELPSGFIPALAPHAVQLHLKDYVVEPMEVGHHLTGRPLGEGMLDLAMVRRAFAGNDHLSEVLLELWTDPAGTAEQTLAKEEAWVRASVERGKSWLSD